MSEKEPSVDNSPKPYGTESLDPRLVDANIEELNERELKLLELRFPDETRELLAYQARQQLRGNEAWMIRMQWKGKNRLPRGLTIGGKEVMGGQYGELIDMPGNRLASYIRLVDDWESESSRQDMLVFGSQPKK